MVDKEFIFIIAVTNEQYYQECVYYIQRLTIPNGYTVDIYTIHDAKSMCSTPTMLVFLIQFKYF